MCPSGRTDSFFFVPRARLDMNTGSPRSMERASGSCILLPSLFEGPCLRSTYPECSLLSGSSSYSCFTASAPGSAVDEPSSASALRGAASSPPPLSFPSVFDWSHSILIWADSAFSSWEEKKNQRSLLNRNGCRSHGFLACII